MGLLLCGYRYVGILHNTEGLSTESQWEQRNDRLPGQVRAVPVEESAGVLRTQFAHH